MVPNVVLLVDFNIQLFYSPDFNKLLALLFPRTYLQLGAGYLVNEKEKWFYRIGKRIFFLYFVIYQNPFIKTLDSDFIFENSSKDLSRLACEVILNSENNS